MAMGLSAYGLVSGYRDYRWRPSPVLQVVTDGPDLAAKRRWLAIYRPQLPFANLDIFLQELPMPAATMLNATIK